MADPFDKLSKPADPFAKLAAPATTDPFTKLAAPTSDSIQKEIEDRSFFDRPVAIPQQVTDEELKQIAGKYGTSTEDLRSALPFLGGLPQDIKASDVLKGAAGFAGESIGLGVPQKLYRMAQDPKQEAALDELKELVSGRKSYLQMGAELAVPGAGLGKVAKVAGEGIRGAAAAGAVAGIAGGFGQSKAGEEIKGAVTGGVLGAGIGAIGGKVAEKLANKSGKALTEGEQSAIKSLDYDKYEQEAIQELQQPGNRTTQELIMGDKTPNKLTAEEIDDVIRANYQSRSLELYLSKRPENPLLNRVNEDLEKNIGFEFAAKRKLIEDVIDNERASALEKIANKKVSNPQQIAEEWSKLQVRGRDFVENEVQKSRIENKILENMENVGAYDLSPESKIGQLLGKLSDTKMHLRTIDEKWNTPAEIELDKLSQGRNIMGAIREKDKQVLDKLDDLATKGNVRKSAENGKIVDLVEGTTTAATPQEAEVANAVRNEFDRIYNFVTKEVEEQGIKGLDIPKLDQYVSRMTKTVPDTLSTIEMELVKATNEANEILGKKYANIAEVSAEEFKRVKDAPAIQNLQQYTNWINNAEVQIPDGARLSMLIRKSLQSDDDIRILDKVARGTMERVAMDYQIPNFIREKNIYKILDRYSQDMLSYIYQREPLARLNSIARVLRARGGISEAKYLETLVEDVNGVRKGTAAHFMRDAKGQIARMLDPKIQAAEAAGDETKVFVYKSLKEMADFPAFLAKQIYPNLLGWRATPILTNAASGFARSAPELGGTYGYATYVRSLVWSRQNWANASKELVEKGYVPGEWTRAGQKALSEGIRASGLVNLPVKALDKLNALGMSLYTKSEELNRISLLGMSKMMAYDLSRGSAAAQNSLSKFPSSVKRAVAKAANADEVGDIIMRHLNSTTAFNYNRPSLYEFGRTMGPMFATFAKWPTAIFGEIVSEYRTKSIGAATRRVAERYAAPLMAFAAVDYMLKDKLEESDRLQTVLGKSGITKAAPIQAVTSFVRGDIFTPPAVDTVMQSFVIPISKGEGTAVAKGIDRAAFMYAPGAGFIKFLTQDVPTMIQGEKPEGSTQTEKTLRTLGVVR